VKSRLLLVDGHAYAYRAFFAIRNLRAPSGRATNAIYGFVKMLGRMRELLKPSHVAVVWDGGLSAERMQLIPAYKAQRPEMPDELSDQLGEISNYLGAAGVRSLQAEGVEADDWIARLAVAGVSEGMPVVIASADKDFFQLVSDGIGLLNPNDKTESLWTAVEVKAKTGVEPAQIVDWLSLVGDAVDNIPGVPGVGTKTAANLLGQFGSVETLYDRVSEVPQERLRSVLLESRDVVRVNQQMIGLRADLAPDCDLGDLKVGSPDEIRLLELSRGWGFKSMTAELEARAVGSQQMLGV